MYQSSGLAEIVRNPSIVTRKYLNIWFTGKRSFGMALKMLGWPITEDESALLVWSKQNGLQLDLKVEEKVMYSKTLLHYVKEKNGYALKINPKKLFSPKHIWYTLLAIWSQSKLLINPQKTYDLAKSFVEKIPLDIPKDKSKIEEDIKLIVWPNLIAVDYMGEFVYSALVNKLNEKEKTDLINELHKKISPRDWYTQAILAWSNLAEKKITKTDFIDKYGFAAGNDYELTSPRYYEVLHAPKPKIKDIILEEMKITNLSDLYVGTQYLRSEAKHKSIIWISALRDEIN